jgi:hypothetical protein
MGSQSIKLCIQTPPSTAVGVVAESLEDKEVFCEAFNQEIRNWEALLRSLKPEDLGQTRPQFGDVNAMHNVRSYIGHMVQNVIDKHGQLSELFYALEYDGSDVYTAPISEPYLS